MNERFKELPEEKQQAVLNAAMEVFSKYDYKKASTDLIAAKAGVSKGLLFYYFHNKKELYLFVYEQAERIITDSIVDSKMMEITDFFELIAYNVTSCAMQAFIAGYCEISLIKSVSERRNYFEPGTDEYYNRKANTSSANTIGNDTGRTSRGIECYPAGTIELGERC